MTSTTTPPTKPTKPTTKPTANPAAVSGGLVSIDGIEHYRIDGVEHMEPFLATVVSESDLWMFVSSTGALTAGRVDADHSLFRYTTDDMIHRLAGRIGPVTVIAREVDGRRELWRPFHAALTAGCTRSMAKSALGDRLVFDEVHPRWGLRFRATWMPSTAYGWVRSVEIARIAAAVDAAGEPIVLDVLDGLLDVMPAGVDQRVEQLTSNLVDAYKRSETGPWGRLALYTLEALVHDQAEPAEALSATTIWSSGFDAASVHLDERVVAAAVSGTDVEPSQLLLGRPGAYLLRGSLTVPVDGSASWMMVADTGLGHPEAVATIHLATSGDAPSRVAADIAAGSAGLAHRLAEADAVQHTGDAVADAHHVSNVLFNAMRGGVFPEGHLVPTAELAEFVADRNAPVADRNAGWLDGLAGMVHVDDLRDAADATGDADLIRLVAEYLPLTFSRRHGDPSRPWNRFSIRVRDASGDEIRSYEGNWRDIFQNWEALLASYPAYLPNVVAKFVNASTPDGFNPYRISDSGIDWEVPEPDDPWSNIGYWGDHQIIYLLRLLESWDQREPGAIRPWLDRAVFTYADVPYVLSDHDEMVRDPRDTITFDEERAALVEQRVEAVGADGRLVVGADGELVHVGLAEKLLVPALAKLGSYVPGGGIWMNTQRPEWNDANNALAGPGISMVTLLYLRRYLGFLADQLDGVDDVRLSATVATWVDDLAAAFGGHEPTPVDDVARRALVDAVGTASAAHRARARDGSALGTDVVAADRVRALLSAASEHLDATIAGARRADGLFHSYGVVEFPTDDTATVAFLGPMLEGQVAAIASGVLSPAEVVDLVDALYASDLHRADLDTFILYPFVELPSFVDRNVVPADSELLAGLDLDGPLRRVLAADVDGTIRFRSEAINAGALDAVLVDAGVDDDVRARVAELYEETFQHAAFTGRSSSMYRYEGLGSVYWHMVAKLLLAVQDSYWVARDTGADDAVVEQLAAAYRRIRGGLGFNMDPASYGAFPTDCYSHTPGNAGAQQPGMTGQVKEEVLTRFGELGLRVIGGRITLQPGLLPRHEHFVDGTATFTWCAVPMTATLGDADRVSVTFAGGRTVDIEGTTLDAAASAAIMARRGEVMNVAWTLLP